MFRLDYCCRCGYEDVVAFSNMTCKSQSTSYSVGVKICENASHVVLNCAPSNFLALKVSHGPYYYNNAANVRHDAVSVFNQPLPLNRLCLALIELYLLNSPII
jgi:hypothetical protein